MSGDAEFLELTEYNARFLSSTLGRFTQPDSIIPDMTNSQGWNRFSYSYNNPINYTDPSGHIPEYECGFHYSGCGTKGEIVTSSNSGDGNSGGGSDQPGDIDEDLNLTLVEIPSDLFFAPLVVYWGPMDTCPAHMCAYQVGVGWNINDMDFFTLVKTGALNLAGKASSRITIFLMLLDLRGSTRRESYSDTPPIMTGSDAVGPLAESAGYGEIPGNVMDAIDTIDAVKQGQITELYCENCAPPYLGYFPGRPQHIDPFGAVVVTYSKYQYLLNSGQLKPHSIFDITIYDNAGD